LGFRLRGRGQPSAVAQTARDAGHERAGELQTYWPPAERRADIWDHDYPDFSGPATITITDSGQGQIAFDALQAGRSSVGFAWEGFDEMVKVSSDGSAKLLDDRSIAIDFACHNGDEAVLKAKRKTSSTTC
jgi:hypothetical protein